MSTLACTSWPDAVAYSVGFVSAAAAYIGFRFTGGDKS